MSLFSLQVEIHEKKEINSFQKSVKYFSIRKKQHEFYKNQINPLNANPTKRSKSLIQLEW